VRLLQLVTLAASLLAVASCKTPKSPETEQEQTSGETAPADRLEAATNIGVDRLFEAAESFRDRSFDQRPALSAVDDLQPPTGSTPAKEVRRERRLLGRRLFNLDDPDDWPAATDDLADIAHYVPDDNQIVYQAEYPSEKTLELALLTAIIEALDHRHFDPLPDGEDWDGSLAIQAAERADAMFAAAGLLFARRTDREPEEVLEQLARRPELSLKLAPLDDFLVRTREERGAPISRADDLAARLQGFQLREGLSLAAALYRSTGWSGVELLRSLAPSSTADIVRPDRWMAGEGLGSWDWSATSGEGTSELETRRTGRVGPALTAIWLGQKFPPKLARTVYSGWRSDAYRYRVEPTEADSAAWRFEWVIQWDTPSSARQITKAFEAVVAQEFGGEEIETQVMRSGLRVGVVLQKGVEVPDEADAALMSLKPTFTQREGVPITFEPTRTERFQKAAARASIDKNVWSDPASRLTADLGPVGDWKIRRSRTLPLRWFARREDGSVLQLTTELADPLGPAFGTDAYRRQLREAFAGSLRKTDVGEFTTANTPFADTTMFHVSGQKDETDFDLVIWHFKRGDLIVTISIQAPTDVFEGRLERANRVVDSIETTGAAPGPTDEKSNESSGTIEYEIEE
jgi:hypothetical protein